MMALSVLAAALPAETPVDPDRNEARRWAIEELSKPQYADAKPSWFDKLMNDFLEWLRSLNSDGSGPGQDWTWPVAILLALALVVAAVIVVRPRLNSGRKRPSAAVFDEEAILDAVTFRSRAAAAAALGDWSTAVVEQFRALVRSAEDRTVIDPQAGRTADEAADQLGRAFSGSQAQLDEAARLFDAVKYGRAAAEAEQYESLRALDSHLATLKPDYQGRTGRGLAVPR
ncbi:DUF4129 domain-containing protein [Arthrobacter celericrescens]|uniref:DUF4129 domain-containing protein n=1 Tax=Arthrobacter celericrescens TaxID=2320851 RepID=UPI001FE0E5AB|nr:DUF4129 domain-containing protein [Arthrobacter celericrescens]